MHSRPRSRPPLRWRIRRYSRTPSRSSRPSSQRATGTQPVRATSSSTATCPARNFLVSRPENAADCGEPGQGGRADHGAQGAAGPFCKRSPGGNTAGVAEGRAVARKSRSFTGAHPRGGTHRWTTWPRSGAASAASLMSTTPPRLAFASGTA
jgi:hypothetical protein